MSHRTVTIEARITVTLPDGVPEADYLRAGMHQMLDSVPHMSATNPHRMAAWPAGREVMVAFEASYSASVPFSPLQPLVSLAELQVDEAQNRAHAMPRELSGAEQGSLL